MINTGRGEVALHVGATQYRLCLTLGALAQLEAGRGQDLKAADLVRIRTLLVQGGGHDISEDEVAAWPLAPQDAADAVTRCLQAGFR